MFRELQPTSFLFGSFFVEVWNAVRETLGLEDAGSQFAMHDSLQYISFAMFCKMPFLVKNSRVYYVND